MREFDRTHGGSRIDVRFITIGSQATADAFCGRHGAGVPCIGDRDKRTYRAMGFENYNLLRLFTDPALRARRSENKAAGFSQDWRATRLGDGAQLPGAAVIDAAGIVRWVHRGTHPGDLPPMREMLERAAALLACV
ncbi:MAG: peroxiredoxin-like family protein [Candidatus Velthaea sp.]